MSTADALPSVTVYPHQPDGGCSPVSWGMLLGTCGLAGILLGYATGFISQWFYLVLLFPIVMGFLVGGVGQWAIRQGKVRSPWLALVAGLVGGSCAVWAMHYYDYSQFRSAQLKDTTPEELAEMKKIGENFEKLRNDPNLDPDVRAFVDHLAANPLFLKALMVDSYWDYVDLEAQQGVTLSKAGDANDKGMNLGYVGSYIYWLVELGIIAGLAMFVMRGAASEPYCLGCHNWKIWRALGAIDPYSGPGKDALEGGNLSRLRELNPAVCAGSHLVHAAVCPNCGAAETVELKLEETTVNEKNEKSVKRLTIVTYPGDAFALVERLFAEGKLPESEPNLDNLIAGEQGGAEPPRE